MILKENRWHVPGLLKMIICTPAPAEVTGSGWALGRVPSWELGVTLAPLLLLTGTWAQLNVRLLCGMRDEGESCRRWARRWARSQEPLIIVLFLDHGYPATRIRSPNLLANTIFSPFYSPSQYFGGQRPDLLVQKQENMFSPRTQLSSISRSCLYLRKIQSVIKLMSLFKRNCFKKPNNGKYFKQIMISKAFVFIFN